MADIAGIKIALAPDGLPAIGPADAPYGRGKDGVPLKWRPGRRPGAKNKTTLALEAKVESLMKDMAPTPAPVVFAAAPPDPAAVAEAAFTTDEAEIAAVVDDTEVRNRVRLVEYARSWQIVRAALKSQKALSLKERATLAMDVIKAAHASKEVFVIDPRNAAEVDMLAEVQSIQRNLARYTKKHATDGDTDGAGTDRN